jgi:poly(A) polymerase
MSARTTATEIVRRLQTAGHAAYWVGGCVRDELRGKEPEDFDIATSALPDQIKALFPHTIPVGRQFGVILVIEEGRQYQVATFRTESDYQDGRRPSRVEFTDAEVDARRRDFTVNGLFYDPVQGRLYDWVGGRADLEARLLRTIGDPNERFAEDHLRLLRAVRFAAQLDFVIEAGTLAAVRQHAPKILSVSGERIRDELIKVFRAPHAGRGLDLLRESGLLEQLLPEVSATINCEQCPEFHPEGSVYQHYRLMLDMLPADADPSLPWLILLHDVAKPTTALRDAATGQVHFRGHEKIGAAMAGAVLERLRFPRKQRDDIIAGVRYHMQFKDAPRMRRATLRRLLMRSTFPLELELHRLDCLGSHGCLETYHFLREQAAELERKPALRPPLITGKDLLALGMSPGPAMGKLLATIREKQLQDELKGRDEALTWVREVLRASQGPNESRPGEP